jgi:hypothetical protein
MNKHTILTMNLASKLKELQTSVPSTYAQIATSISETTPLTQHIKPKPTLKQVRSKPDTGLFIRISPTYLAHKAAPFAIFMALRKALGPESKLLKEVQEVRSGYALCTGSQESLATFETKIPIIASMITDCTIEHQPYWIIY